MANRQVAAANARISAIFAMGFSLSDANVFLFALAPSKRGSSLFLRKCAPKCAIAMKICAMRSRS
jgi:hypothetical protein